MNITNPILSCGEEDVGDANLHNVDESERGASPCMEKSFISPRIKIGHQGKDKVCQNPGPELQMRAGTIIEKAIGSKSGLPGHSFT